MSERTLRVKADTSQLDSDLAQADDRTQRLISSIATGVRQATELSILFVEASGMAIDQILQMQIQAGFRAIELAVEIQGLFAAGTFGASALLSVGLQTAAIASMLITIHQIQSGRQEQAARTRKITAAFQYMTFMG